MAVDRATSLSGRGATVDGRNRPGNGVSASIGPIARTDERGLSTPIDVSIALVLVAASVLVIGGIDPVEPDPPDVQGSALLGGPLEITYNGDAGTVTVAGTVGGLMSDAAVVATTSNSAEDAAFVSAVEHSADRELERRGVPAQVVATCNRSDAGSVTQIEAGPRPPADAVVYATVYRRTPASPRDGAERTDRCEPLIVVRRWSP